MTSTLKKSKKVIKQSFAEQAREKAMNVYNNSQPMRQSAKQKITRSTSIKRLKGGGSTSN